MKHSADLVFFYETYSLFSDFPSKFHNVLLESVDVVSFLKLRKKVNEIHTRYSGKIGSVLAECTRFYYQHNHVKIYWVTCSLNSD